MIRGKWKFVRRIHDYLTQTIMDASGTLVVDDQKWHEEGLMGDRSFFRTYKVNLEDGFSVLFLDGTHFYHLRSIDAVHEMKHRCKQDVYQGKWIWQDDRFTLVWEVRGPDKNYLSRTLYHRLTETN